MLESVDSYLAQILLYCCTSFDTETNTLVLNSTIDYILSTKRFKESLLYKSLAFDMQFLNSFRNSVCLLYLSAFLFLTYYFLRFFNFVLPGSLDFQCPVIVIFSLIVSFWKKLHINKQILKTCQGYPDVRPPKKI